MMTNYKILFQNITKIYWYFQFCEKTVANGKGAKSNSKHLKKKKKKKKLKVNPRIQTNSVTIKKMLGLILFEVNVRTGLGGKLQRHLYNVLNTLFINMLKL